MSTFRAAAGPSVNIAYGRGTFCQLSVLSRELPLTYVNFLCGHRTFCQHSSTSRAAGNILSISVNFLCGRRTFIKLSVWPQGLPSTFCAAMKLSINFQCCRGTFCQLLSPFWAAGGTSVIFRQIFVRPQNLSSTSINFLCLCRTFHQISVRTRDILSISITFPCCQKTFLQLLSTFHVVARPFVNFPHGRGTFHQISVLPLDQFVMFLCCCGTFR